MRKIWLIVKREYLTRVKSKGFIIGTIIVPVLGVAFFLLIMFLVNHQPTQSMRVVIVDNSGMLAQSVRSRLDAKLDDGQPEFTVVETIVRPAAPDAVQQDLRARINSGSSMRTYGFLRTSANRSNCIRRIPATSVSMLRSRELSIRQ